MDFTGALISIIVLIYSAILHEVAHGWVAYRLGDPTAKLKGRITLNPIPHIDPFMSILVPFVLIFSGAPIIFGGAKPVPVDPFNLRDGHKDMAIVSLVGPLTNFALAIIAAILIHAINPLGILGEILSRIVFLNLILGIFNLIPIPPLDGSKVFSLLLPQKAAMTYLSIGSMGMFILLILLFLPGSPVMQIVYSLVIACLRLLGF
ncbi:MAG TPA: site-2 protease family protein [Patescibacteria group bacterium]|nr:site-2 protease family protein [Patescibacteria group bacterium]